MKKIYTLALLATLAIVGCSKVNPENELKTNGSYMGIELSNDLIGYDVVNYASQTKANTAYYEGGHFGSYALFTGTSNFAVANIASYAKFINDAEVYFHDSKWAPATAQYWPKSGKLTFLSYSPKTANLTVGTTINDNNTEDNTADDYVSDLLYKDGYTVAAAYTTQISNTEKTNDLMIADITKDKSANDDPGVYKLSGVTKGVPTLFRHALAKVSFSAKAAVETQGNLTFHIVINSIAINAINTVGNVKFNSKNEISWTSQGTSGNSGNLWTKTSGDAQAVNADYATKSDALGTSDYVRRMNNTMDYYVLPQTLGNGSKIVVNYTIYSCNASGKILDVQTYEDEKQINTTGTSAWAVNKQYVYRLTINPLADEIVWDPAIASFDDAVNTDYEIKPGTPLS